MVFRAKRDTSQPPAAASPSPSIPSAPAQPATAPTNGVAAPAANSAGTASSATGTPASQPKVENPVRLLGANGTGQRKEYNTTNSAGPVSLPSPASPSQQPSAENKSSSINQSLGAVQTNSSQPPVETPVSDIEEADLDKIDTPIEAINKTIQDHLDKEHLVTQLPKTDYFQYYNSTTFVDKNKSDEYWSQKKEYIVSSILSKSHRRAIVSRVCDIS